MKGRLILSLAVLAVFATLSLPAMGQPNDRAMDQKEGRSFIPDRVPVEADLIPVDKVNLAALEFFDKSRIAIAALITSEYPLAVKEKYHYVFVTETRLKFGSGVVPAGIVGLTFVPEGDQAAIIARDFSGAEVSRFVLQIEPDASAGSLSLAPKGAGQFELRIGKYVILGARK